MSYKGRVDLEFDTVWQMPKEMQTECLGISKL